MNQAYLFSKDYRSSQRKKNTINFSSHEHAENLSASFDPLNFPHSAHDVIQQDDWRTYEDETLAGAKTQTNTSTVFFFLEGKEKEKNGT